jgi:hypothetical protein
MRDDYHALRQDVRSLNHVDRSWRPSEGPITYAANDAGFANLR